MSKKPIDSLPADEFTWTLGSNYGLDGYHFDQTMGEGVANRKSQPGASPGGVSVQSHKGISELPDGLTKKATSSLNIEDIMQPDSGMSLASMFTEEEGSFPDSPIDLSWLDPTQEQDPDRLPHNSSVHMLDELSEVWSRNKPSRRIEAQDHRPKSPDPIANMDQLRTAVQKAVRDAHFGKSLMDIKRDLVAALGEDASHTRGVVDKIKQDMGLAGKVFIRASAFPGLKNGRWVNEIRKKASQARYVITEDPTLGSKLGMQAVSEIPWGEAYAHYAPLLQAAGHRLGSQASPQERLRQAFLAPKPSPTRTQAHKPVEIRLADTITTSEALAAFKEKLPEPQAPVLARESSRRHKALVQLTQWMKAGSLTATQVASLRTLDTEEMMREATLIINSKPAQEYSGSGVVASHVGGESRKSGIPVAEFSKLASWMRKSMNDGVRGEELTQKLQSRWSPEILRVAKVHISRFRDMHEDRIGQQYIEAEAYASPSGSEGCKKASLHHRSNSVPLVLQMDRCGSCVHKKGMLDGTTRCSVYNKQLVEIDEVPKKKKASDKPLVKRSPSEYEDYGLIASMDTSLSKEVSAKTIDDITLDAF